MEKDSCLMCYGLFPSLEKWVLLRLRKGCMVTNMGGNTGARGGAEQSNLKLGA